MAAETSNAVLLKNVRTLFDFGVSATHPIASFWIGS